MDVSEIWPRLSSSTQTWLIEHNGEPLPDDILDEILTVTSGQQDPRWWARDSGQGETQLSDAAVDWIEETANRE
jgi:hypothetical protein